MGEPVVLFRLPEEDPSTSLEGVTREYRQLLVTIGIGSFVAQADGRIAERERATLEARIADAQISDAERLRLHANLRWMLEVPLDLPLLRRRLKWVPPTTCREIGRLMLAVAAVDGAFDPAEVQAIERLYGAMGLSADCLGDDLRSLTVGDEPIAVRPAQPTIRGYGIPAPPREDSRLVLDPERVNGLIEDTARVSALLGEIFREDEVEESDEGVMALEDATSNENGFGGLDWRHTAFLRKLLTRPKWDAGALARIAAGFELMPSGSLETLNEWTFDQFGEPVIEEHSGYEINPAIGAALAEMEAAT